MIDLYGISSLPIQFDYQDTSFIFNDCITCGCRKKIELDHLTPTLLNKSLKYPEIVYAENENLYSTEDSQFFNETGLHYDIVALPAGLLGIEYIKTHVYYSPEEEGKYSSVVECLHGTLTVLIQKNKPKDEYEFQSEVEEGMMIKLRQGEKIAIPTGYYYTFINTRNLPAIFSRTYKNKGMVDYGMLANEQGLAYFAIRKNARTEVVYNPRYKTVPDIQKFTPTNEKFRYRFTKRPIYEQIRKEINYFLDSLAAVSVQ